MHRTEYKGIDSATLFMKIKQHSTYVFAARQPSYSLVAAAWQQYHCQ
jgi:hypothetical protein